MSKNKGNSVKRLSLDEMPAMDHRKVFGCEADERAAIKRDITEALDSVYDGVKRSSASVEANVHETGSDECDCGCALGYKQCTGCSQCEVKEQGCCNRGNPCRECRDTEKAYALEKIKKELEAQARKATNRRCLVEELKSTAENIDGSTGESDTVRVSYEYANDTQNGNFRSSDRPTKVSISANSFVLHDKGEPYTKLQLQAHIKNLQTILDTLS